ncbi:MAG: hypothetical protein V3U37_07465, partial [Nitrospinaceae bacterium]
MKYAGIVRTIVLAAVFTLMGTPAYLGAAGGELSLFKDDFYDADSFGGPKFMCEGIFYVDLEKNVPDLRDFNYYHCDGVYTLTLEGPSGTVVTLYDRFEFDANGGYITLRKTDDRTIWVYDLEKFSSDQWTVSEADKYSGAFEVYYHASPLFKSNISS